MLTVILLILLSVAARPVQAQENINAPTQGDTLLVIEQGTGGTIVADVDYDAYVKALYGEPEASQPAATEPEQTPLEVKRQRRPNGPPPGLFVNSRLNGMHIAFNGASPFSVSDQLESWYSYIDAGITLKLSYEIMVEDMPIYTLFEISTFSFENSFPQGGSFAGMAYILQASRIGDNAAAVVGFGFWESNLGSMMEINYRLRPTTNTFLRVGTRGVLISNIDPLGPVWWLELRFSMGLEL